MGEPGRFCKPCRLDLVLTSLKFLRSWGSKSNPKDEFPPGGIRRHLKVSSHVRKSRSSSLFACETEPENCRDTLVDAVEDY